MDEILSIPDAGFGILSPAQGAASPVALVLLNAGLTHRVGPFRCYVQFARRLASRGTHVFRFDLPRVGDGRPGGPGTEAIIARVLDLVEQRTGTRRFVLGGICSAADMAWLVARGDPRVAGLWLFDGFARRGPWYALARLRRVLRKPPREWPAVLSRVLGRLRRTPVAMQDARSMLYRDWPEADEFRAQAQRYLEQGVRILAMYTGGVSAYLLHPRQLKATFGRASTHPGLRLDYRPELDHTLMSPLDREAVAARLGDWMADLATAARA